MSKYALTHTHMYINAKTCMHAHTTHTHDTRMSGRAIRQR